MIRELDIRDSDNGGDNDNIVGVTILLIIILLPAPVAIYTHTHTHSHTQRERDNIDSCRQTVRYAVQDKYNCNRRIEWDDRSRYTPTLFIVYYSLSAKTQHFLFSLKIYSFILFIFCII